MFSVWIHSTITTFLLVLSTVCALGAIADDASETQPQTPHQLVEVVTNDLLEAISVHRDTFDENPEEFFTALDDLLKDVVDFEWIAYKVMGSYGKRATPEQRALFARAFRCELIETYGRGLVAYGEQSIVVLPPDEDINGLRKVTVVQEIRGSDGVFPLVYSMGLNREGMWKVTNVVINGINLGKTFRNQFVQSAQKFGGDINQVINNWSSSAG
jgi:phospholipid transport system substrate-binding protein